jgi:hypothetical protein
MEDQNWGAAEPIRQSIQDLVHTIGHHIGLIPDPPPNAHDQAIQDMNKQANDQRVQDATKSFIKPDAAAVIRKKAMGK